MAVKRLDGGVGVAPTFAITSQREPLDGTDAWMWARQQKGTADQRPGPKASLYWTERYKRVAQMAAEVHSTRRVYAANRESDIVELLPCAQG